MHSLCIVHGDLKGVCTFLKLDIYPLLIYEGKHSYQQGQTSLYC